MFDFLKYFCILLYIISSVFLCIFGLHRYYLVHLYSRAKARRRAAPEGGGFLPRVTVQLPVYNEMYVAERLIRAVCGIDYPKELLEVQVLDDSTDDTSRIAARCAEDLRASGFDIKHIRRGTRKGTRRGACRGLCGGKRGVSRDFRRGLRSSAGFSPQDHPMFREPAGRDSADQVGAS